MKIAGIRLDKYLTGKFTDLSRSKIQKMIKSGDVLVNGKTSKASYVLNESDDVYVKEIVQEKFELKEEKQDIPILFEKKDYFVIDKPAGIVVHPSETGDKKGTVVNKLLKKIKKGVGEKNRPGIVHRLDKNTSGLLIIAKTKKGYEYFVEQFKKRAVRKIYLTLVRGCLNHKEGIIDSPIGRNVKERKKMGIVDEDIGKRAVSEYKVLKEFEIDKKVNVSLVEVEIKTGRTHQIRVHMSAIGHSVVGDNNYGAVSFNKKFSEKFGLERQFLHAYKLKFKDPDSGEIVNVKSDLPKDLSRVLERLE